MQTLPRSRSTAPASDGCGVLSPSARLRARALTIPIHWLAYGKRVGELQRTMTVYRPKGTNILATNINGVLTPLYVLKAAVTLPQDRPDLAERYRLWASLSALATY